jgi:DNA-binding transcriptional MerR regulator
MNEHGLRVDPVPSNIREYPLESAHFDMLDLSGSDGYIQRTNMSLDDFDKALQQYLFISSFRQVAQLRDRTQFVDFLLKRLSIEEIEEYISLCQELHLDEYTELSLDSPLLTMSNATTTVVLEDAFRLKLEELRHRLQLHTAKQHDVDALLHTLDRLTEE